MKLLIVEGNNEETRVSLSDFGISPYHILFKRMLSIIKPNAQTEVVFPSDLDGKLPSVKDLKNYDGVLWTGSSLSVYDDNQYVNRQLNFGEDIFQSGVPFYGSCWGMQIATVVAGGKVAPSSKGLEIGVTNHISPTKEGKQSQFFTHRKKDFSALCVHYDEVVELPENAIVLASNSHSYVQAMTFKYKNSNFFGVQYHPEFKAKDIALISDFRTDELVKNGSFTSKKKVDEFSHKLKEQIDLPNEVVDFKLHSQEIDAWLNSIY